MSRLAFKEPLAAVHRHMSNPSPPRNSVRHISNSPSRRTGLTFQSKMLSALDAELERPKLEGTSSATGTSNTMEVALHASKTWRAGGSMTEASGSNKSADAFSPEPSTATTGSKTVPSSSDVEVYTSRSNMPHAVEGSLTETTSNFPLYTYKSYHPTPRMHYVRDGAEANELVTKLKGPLGFDLEWRVFFGRRMAQRKAAIVQLCDESMILIIQLTAMEYFPIRVKEVLESEEIIKMGVNILNDGRKLQHDYGVRPAGLLELSHLAHLADPDRVTSKRMISLQRIVEMYTGRTLSKGSIRTSNWEAKLNEEQLEYAANDAHSALKVYTKLMQMALDAGMVLKPGPSGKSSTPAMNVTLACESTRTNLNTDQGRLNTANRPSRGVSGLQSRTASGQFRGRFGFVHITSPAELHAPKPNVKRPVSGQVLRAYQLWHEEQVPLPHICAALRTPENPLTKGTIISYVVRALKTDTSLPFSRVRLVELAKLEEASWVRHGEWIRSLTSDRGLPP